MIVRVTCPVCRKRADACRTVWQHSDKANNTCPASGHPIRIAQRENY